MSRRPTLLSLHDALSQAIRHTCPQLSAALDAVEVAHRPDCPDEERDAATSQAITALQVYCLTSRDVGVVIDYEGEDDERVEAERPEDMTSIEVERAR